MTTRFRNIVLLSTSMSFTLQAMEPTGPEIDPRLKDYLLMHPVLQTTLPHASSSAAYNKDGTLLALANGNNIDVLNPSDRSLISTLQHKHPVIDIAFKSNRYFGLYNCKQCNKLECCNGKTANVKFSTRQKS